MTTPDTVNEDDETFVFTINSVETSDGSTRSITITKGAGTVLDRGLGES